MSDIIFLANNKIKKSDFLLYYLVWKLWIEKYMWYLLLKIIYPHSYTLFVLEIKISDFAELLNIIFSGNNKIMKSTQTGGVNNSISPVVCLTPPRAIFNQMFGSGLPRPISSLAKSITIYLSFCRTLPRFGLPQWISRIFQIIFCGSWGTCRGP